MNSSIKIGTAKDRHIRLIEHGRSRACGPYSVRNCLPLTYSPIANASCRASCAGGNCGVGAFSQRT